MLNSGWHCSGSAESDHQSKSIGGRSVIQNVFLASVTVPLTVPLTILHNHFVENGTQAARPSRRVAVPQSLPEHWQREHWS
jgi:hypothetical protein